MEHEEQHERGRGADQATAAHFTDDAGTDGVLAWEEVAAGRYMPRRIKGSCKGRALG
jgi:hypothetical protein